MQYLVKRGLKPLRYRFLFVFMGALSVCFSGYAQKRFVTLADMKSAKHDFTKSFLTENVRYHNLSKVEIKDTVDITDADNTIIVAIGIMTPWEKIKEKKMHWAIKTNLLYAATLTPNLGLEFGWGSQMSLNITGSYNPWNRKGRKGHNDKIVHWMIQPEWRYWFCEPASGHFIGVHAIATKYNIGGHKFFDMFDKKYRYEGWGAGAGFTYGYSWMLSERWTIETYLGLGVVQLGFDKSNNRNWCCTKSEHYTKTYVGPTKIGISLIYNIK